MTQAIKNKINMEPEPEEIWREWQDGDDSALYDSGYYDGLVKAITILDSVRLEKQVDRLPSSFTVSVVIAKLREILKGNDE
jgi:hypothetical protein